MSKLVSTNTTWCGAAAAAPESALEFDRAIFFSGKIMQAVGRADSKGSDRVYCEGSRGAGGHRRRMGTVSVEDEGEL